MKKFFIGMLLNPFFVYYVYLVSKGVFLLYKEPVGGKTPREIVHGIIEEDENKIKNIIKKGDRI